MPTLSVSDRLYDAIERYRQDPSHDHEVCRFRPTCSLYAQQALTQKRLPVALFLIAGRLLRCNPLVRRGTADPLSRRRRRPRPNAVASFMSLLAVVGGMVLMGVAVAEASGVEGGCVATINGADPASLTESNPLVVHKGQSVTLSGQVPAAIRNLPKSQLTSRTAIKVHIVEGGFSNTTVRNGQGPQWGGSVNVDKYLKYGVGLYKVDGSAVGTPNWACTGTAYVRLEDGNPLGKPVGAVAAGLVVLGAAGAAFAPRSGEPTAEDIKQEFKADAENLLGLPPDEPKPEPEVSTDQKVALGANLGCLFVLLVLLMGGPMTGPSFAAAAGSVPSAARGRRIWKRGHAVAGFVSGLLFGLGVMVLGQQYGRWTLSIVTVVVIPLVAALVVGFRAWYGQPYRVTFPPSAVNSERPDA
jgi:putative component of membrane protein insertase Oxa1/YidC/SpoIIIJ protein YidD